METIEIKNRLEALKNRFAPQSQLYIEIETTLKNGVASNNGIESFEKIINDPALSPDIKEYVSTLFFNAKKINEKMLQLKASLEKVNEKTNELKEEFSKRGMDPSSLKTVEVPEIKSEADLDKYIELVTNDLQNLEKIKAGLNIKKEVGEEFDKSVVQETKVVDNKAFKDASKEAPLNIKRMVNPTIEQLNTFMSYYSKNKTNDETFKTKIIKNSQSDTIDIELNHVGTAVNEKNQKLVLSFTDISKSNNEALYRTILNYATTNSTKGAGYDNGLYTNTAKSGDTLEMEGFDDDIITLADNTIKKVQESSQQEKPVSANGSPNNSSILEDQYGNVILDDQQNEIPVDDNGNIIDPEQATEIKMRKERGKVRKKVREQPSGKASSSSLVSILFVLLVIGAIILTIAMLNIK